MKDRVQIRDVRRRGFFTVDNEVIDRTDIGAYAKLVYAVLCRFAGNDDGECRLLRNTIAEKAGISVSSVYRAVRDLDSVGLVRVETSINEASIYTLLQVVKGGEMACPTDRPPNLPCPIDSLPCHTDRVPCPTDLHIKTAFKETSLEETASLGSVALVGEIIREKSRSKVEDVRHAPIREKLKAAWLEKNLGAPKAPWGPKEAGLLSKLLRENPGWTLDKLMRCVANYATGQWPAPLSVVIVRLLDLVSGPRDKYFSPLEGSGDGDRRFDSDFDEGRLGDPREKLRRQGIIV